MKIRRKSLINGVISPDKKNAQMKASHWFSYELIRNCMFSWSISGFLLAFGKKLRFLVFEPLKPALTLDILPINYEDKINFHKY